MARWAGWAGSALLLIGCSQNYSDKQTDEALKEKGLQAESDQPAQSSQQLPTGHPPLETAPQQLPAGPSPLETGAAGSPVKAGQRQSLGGLSVALPAGWRSVPPSSSMRKAEYVLPGQGRGDASLIAFYFGPDQGGSVEANIERWYGQFSQPDGRPTSEMARRREKQVAGMPATLVDISGTYTAGMGSAQGPQPGFRMLGAILGTPAGSFFFKLVGPDQTVTRWASSFEEFIDSARPE